MRNNEIQSAVSTLGNQNAVICYINTRSINFTITTINASTTFTSHTSNHQIIEHSAYILQYNEKYEHAEWVIYLLTQDRVADSFERTDNFRPDPKVITGSASLADYKGSGYDRGHLAPAADMKWSENVMSESFFMSNMSPQKPGFNRGIWKSLESIVRTWAIENNEIYIVT